MIAALQAGERKPGGEIVERGYLSKPLCGQRMDGNYRMTINVPLANACKKCCAIADKF